MRSIWAVAINTLKQALRIRIAVVFILILLVLLPVMGSVMTGDGTIKGRLQTFVSYSLSLMSLLLCLLTIVVSTYSLTSDLEQRQIYTVLTKPVGRWQVLLGKLLGVILLDTALLVLFSIVIYAITIDTPKFLKASKAELSQLDNEFFTARASLVPPEVDVTDEVRDVYAKLEKAGQLPAEVSTDKIARRNYIGALTRRLKLGKRAAAVGSELIWEFENVKPFDPDQSLFVRFKYKVSIEPPDKQVYGKWFVGDYRQIRYGGKIEKQIYFFDRKDLIGTFCEIEVPADAVADDGYLAVGFLNVPLNDTVVIFPPEDGLEVLYKADTFSANFLRAVVLIFFRLIFLACLGILASSFLSFPVAILLCLVVFSTACFSGFILESFEYLGGSIGWFYSYTIKTAIRLLPQFDKFNPVKFLVSARLLSWSFLAKVGGLTVCIKATLLLLLALLVFRFREIAKVIV